MEKQIETKLRVKVKAKGGIALKWTSSINGVPDRIVFMPLGKLYFVELKFGKNGLSVKQVYVQKLLKSLGFSVYNIKNNEELQVFLETI